MAEVFDTLQLIYLHRNPAPWGGLPLDLSPYRTHQKLKMLHTINKLTTCFFFKAQFDDDITPLRLSTNMCVCYSLLLYLYALRDGLLPMF